MVYTKIKSNKKWIGRARPARPFATLVVDFYHIYLIYILFDYCYHQFIIFDEYYKKYIYLSYSDCFFTILLMRIIRQSVIVVITYNSTNIH